MDNCLIARTTVCKNVVQDHNLQKKLPNKKLQNCCLEGQFAKMLSWTTICKIYQNSIVVDNLLTRCSELQFVKFAKKWSTTTNLQTNNRQGVEWWISKEVVQNNENVNLKIWSNATISKKLSVITIHNQKDKCGICVFYFVLFAQMLLLSWKISS